MLVRKALNFHVKAPNAYLKPSPSPKMFKRNAPKFKTWDACLEHVRQIKGAGWKMISRNGTTAKPNDPRALTGYSRKYYACSLGVNYKTSKAKENCGGRKLKQSNKIGCPVKMTAVYVPSLKRVVLGPIEGMHNHVL